MISQSGDWKGYRPALDLAALAQPFGADPGQVAQLNDPGADVGGDEILMSHGEFLSGG